MCLATSGRMYAIANLSIPSSRVNTDFPFRNVAAAKAPLLRRGFHHKHSQNQAQRRVSSNRGRMSLASNRQCGRRHRPTRLRNRRGACMWSPLSRRYRRNEQRTAVQVTRRWPRGSYISSLCCGG